VQHQPVAADLKRIDDIAAALDYVTWRLSQDAGELRTVLDGVEYQTLRDDTVMYRGPCGGCPEAVREVARKIADPLEDAYKAVTHVVQADKTDPQEPTPKAQLVKLMPEMGAIRDRLDNAIRLFGLLADQPEPNQAPIARWTEAGLTISIWPAAPVAAGPALRQCLWGRCGGALVASAKVTAVNSWGRLAKKAGLGHDGGT
jgi:Fe-S cluster biogenesis protein NfuA